MGRSDSSPPSLGQEVTAADAVPQRPVLSLSDPVTGADLLGFEASPIEESAIESLEQRYEIIGVIGRGGMGDVLRGMDRKLGRQVAIKRIREEFAGSRTAFERFRREAHSIAALNHPHIVRVYDFGRDPDGPFLVMELVDGQSLAEQLRQSGTLDEATVRQLGVQLCGALAAAHRRGIIHRDIKPANILVVGVQADGTFGDRTAAKLTDFGLARDHRVDGGITQSGAMLGTLDFMPPEQRRDAQAVDERSDLWSLGATLYQLLTGEPPRILRSDRLPDSLRDIIVKSLETKPDDRFQAAAEFGAALGGEGAVPSKPKDSRTPAGGHSPPYPLRNHVREVAGNVAGRTRPAVNSAPVAGRFSRTTIPACGAAVRCPAAPSSAGTAAAMWRKR